jgi:hypothetical protein
MPPLEHGSPFLRPLLARARCQQSSARGSCGSIPRRQLLAAPPRSDPLQRDHLRPASHAVRHALSDAHSISLAGFEGLDGLRQALSPVIVRDKKIICQDPRKRKRPCPRSRRRKLCQDRRGMLRSGLFGASRFGAQCRDRFGVACRGYRVPLHTSVRLAVRAPFGLTPDPRRTWFPARGHLAAP